MPVNRSYITSFAFDPASVDLYQALVQLANFSDALEKSAGVSVGSAAGQQAASPQASSWTIVASEGHYVIQIAPPVVAAPIQHQLRSALDQNFDANSSTNTYTLGLAQTTLDLVDPNETRYWQMRSRYQGSAWNSWRSYANGGGVLALNAGILRTS